jgi:hypothetical protein
LKTDENALLTLLTLRERESPSASGRLALAHRSRSVSSPARSRSSLISARSWRRCPVFWWPPRKGPYSIVCSRAGVHFVEGNLLTPIVQAEVVKLPPVVTLFAALIFGLLLGPIGVLLAAPLTVVLLVAVNCFYNEDVLGDRRVWPPVAGARSP